MIEDKKPLNRAFLEKIAEKYRLGWCGMSSVNERILIRFHSHPDDVANLYRYIQSAIENTSPGFWHFGVSKGNRFYLTTKLFDDAKNAGKDFDDLVKAEHPNFHAQVNIELQRLIEAL
jgi:hypothetical protein